MSTVRSADTFSHRTWPQWFCILFGIVAIFAYVPIYSGSIQTYAWGVATQVFGSMVFWMSFLLVTITMQGPRLTYLYYFRNYQPTDINVIEEVQKYKLEDELEWAVMTSRPPDDNDEHFAAKPPPSAGTQASMGPILYPASPFAGAQEMVQLDNGPQSALGISMAPVLLPTMDITDSPESMPKTIGSPYNVFFMNTAGSVASGGSLSDEAALRLNRGGSASIRDMQTDTVVPHRGYSFSQGRGASIIILGARIKEKWVSSEDWVCFVETDFNRSLSANRFKRTMSRADRGSASSSRTSLSAGLFPTTSNRSAGGGSADGQGLSSVGLDFGRSLPALGIASPASSDAVLPMSAPSRTFVRADSSPSSPTSPDRLASGPTVRTQARVEEPASAPSRIPGTLPLPSLDTIASASEAAGSVSVLVASEPNLNLSSAATTSSSVVALSPLTDEPPK
jgi:hypothetical protein